MFVGAHLGEILSERFNNVSLVTKSLMYVIQSEIKSSFIYIRKQEV